MADDEVPPDEEVEAPPPQEEENTSGPIPIIPINAWYHPNVADAREPAVCFHEEESWQDDIHLYEPYEVEQVLSTDFANCLAVQAFLKMCNLNFTVEMRSNAEFMSPSGQVPFIKCGSFVVSELDPIVAFFGHKNVSLSNGLNDKDKGDMRAYMSLVNTVLTNAEQYVLWNVPEVLSEITKPRYGSVYPWPLDSLLCWRKRRQCMSRLKVYGWLSKNLSEMLLSYKVYDEVHKCCSTLASRLDKGPYFFGSSPTELDALVFGHVFTLMSTPLPNNRLASTVRNFPELTSLSNRIEREFFANSEHLKALSNAANAAAQERPPSSSTSRAASHHSMGSNE